MKNKLLGEASGYLGELGGIGRQLPNPYVLVGPTIRREAVLSSRIEGTLSGMDDLFFFEARPQEKPSWLARAARFYAIMGEKEKVLNLLEKERYHDIKASARVLSRF